VLDEAVKLNGNTSDVILSKYYYHESKCSAPAEGVLQPENSGAHHMYKLDSAFFYTLDLFEGVRIVLQWNTVSWLFEMCSQFPVSGVKSSSGFRSQITQ
jgi:hypothetical protein